MNKLKQSNLFRNIVIGAVLVIPFMYSFFYLKAYWNPYGEGNIDNIPIAIVNEDKGDKGAKLVESIQESGKLKPELKTTKEADECLQNTKCYAKIVIPSDFTESMESAGTTDKKHAEITYSPNQKSNYLASQIINSVVNAVEKSLDNQVNAAIIENLTDSLNQVPDSLETISDGFGELQDGTNQLKDGSNTLRDGAGQLASGATSLQNGSQSIVDGLANLNSGYAQFNNGINSAYEGSLSLNAGLEQLNSASQNLGLLIDSSAYLDSSYTQFDDGLQQYITGVNQFSAAISSSSTQTSELITNLLTYAAMQNAGYPEDIYTQYLTNAINTANTIKATSEAAAAAGQSPTAIASTLQESGALLSQSSTQLRSGISQLSAGTNQLSSLASGVAQLKSGSDSLSAGLNTLNEKSNDIQSGIIKLYDGASALNNGSKTLLNGAASLSNGSVTLSDGMTTLNDSVAGAKNKLDKKINETKTNLKSTDGLSEYAESPVTITNDIQNEVDSYGTSFAPLFISIGLWVGALMSYVVLYYDKQKRFGNLGIDGKNYTKRTLSYHAIATSAGFVLALLLQIFLDFNITNIFLYYISVILISNTFMAIMELLIVNFGDIGKFLGLIILVLQLAAAGGTFPIETVSEGFRWLNGILPMTYTIRLLKESLISTENSLLIPNLLIVTILCAILMTFNVLNSHHKDQDK